MRGAYATQIQRREREDVVQMKTATILVLAGALLGVAVASLVVPPAMAWYTSPGGLPQGAQVQAIVQIPEVIRYATSHLIRGQMIGSDRRCSRIDSGNLRERRFATTASRG